MTTPIKVEQAEGMGASATADRAVVNGAASVSALRASVPSAVTCIIINCRRRAPAGEPFCSEHR